MIICRSCFLEPSVNVRATRDQVSGLSRARRANPNLLMLQTPGSTWSQWRKFPFIARAEVGEPPVDKGKGKEREDAAPALVGLAPLPASNLDWLTSDDAAEITCVAPGRRFAYLGDVLGRVHVVDSKLELVDSFEAHEPPIPAPPPPIPGNPASNAQKRETARRGPVLSFRLAAARAGIRLVGVTHLAWNADRNVLVTAGEDKNGLPVVRLWNLDKMDRTTGRPQMLREVSASLDQRPIPVCLEGMKLPVSVTQTFFSTDNVNRFAPCAYPSRDWPRKRHRATGPWRSGSSRTDHQEPHSLRRRKHDNRAHVCREGIGSGTCHC